MKNVILIYVPNNDLIYRFVENISVCKDFKSFLKLTKNIDVAGRHGATKSFESIDLTLEKADKNCENAQ